MPSFPSDIVVSSLPTAPRYERMRYFNGLFLEEGDFATEQGYFLSVRRFLNFLLFDDGRLYEVTGTDPLQVSSAGLTLTISQGSALVRDTTRRLGYEINLLSQTINLGALPVPLRHNDTVTVNLGHADFEFTSPAGVTGVPSAQNDRVQEQGVIHVIVPGDPLPTGPQITLATVVARATSGVAGAIADTLTVTNTTQRGGVRLQILSQAVLAAMGGGTSPTIGTFTTSGPVGAVVIINGTNLSGATGLRFGATAATITSNTAVEIRTTVPAGATTGPITITFPGGVSVTTPTNFTVTVAVPAPTITNLNPPSGPVLSPVTIIGTNFTGATSVTFGGVAATVFVVVSPTEINATVPAGAVTGPVVVNTPGGSATSPAPFTVVVPPVIIGLDVTSQLPGGLVTVTGTNIHLATLFRPASATAPAPPNNTTIRLLAAGQTPAFVDATLIEVRTLAAAPVPQTVRFTMPPRPGTWPATQAVTVRLGFGGATTDFAGPFRYA